MAMQDRVIEAAEKWLGYLEKKSNASLDSLTANAGSNNYTIFARQYANRWDEDYQGQPWCAVFVSCMLYEGCGGKELVPHFAYCPYGVQGFKERGQWHTSNPQRGDVIFFRNSQGVACHVGLVSSVRNGNVITIEGNTSSEPGVVANGGCVRQKTYSLDYSRILGYGRPAYPKEETKPETQGMTIEQVKQIVNQTLADWAIPVTIDNKIAAVKKEILKQIDQFQEYLTDEQMIVDGLDVEMKKLRQTIQELQEKIKSNDYNVVNPLYTTIQQVPKWWQQEVWGMMQTGAIQGDGQHDIAIRKEALQAAVIAYRASHKESP